MFKAVFASTAVMNFIRSTASVKPVFLLEVSRDLWNRVPCSRDVPNEWVFSRKNTGFADECDILAQMHPKTI